MEQSRFKQKTGLTEKQYVLGRKDKLKEGVLNIGRYYALDSSLGSDVFLDILRPHVILICGKRGYGKSYTIGVFLEEIAKLEQAIREKLGVVVVDTLGIYWTTNKANTEERTNLKDWGLDAKGFDTNLVVPKKYEDYYRNNGINATGFSIKVSELTAFHWCQLFNINPTDPLGVVLTRSVTQLQKSNHEYSISDIIKFIQNDKRSGDNEKGAAENFLGIADTWGIFDKKGVTVNQLVKRGAITILDISQLPNQEIKDIVTSLIGEKIFHERVKERKIHEQRKMGLDIEEKGMPMVWMVIDEAQLFMPHDKKTIGKDVFINEWMRQGRQPGLSLLMATQRPSALDPEVCSHSDIIICHRLTAQEDIDSLSKIRPSFMHGDMQGAIKKVGDEKGVALIVDDVSESAHVIKIRPRQSWHGGTDSLVVEKNKN